MLDSNQLAELTANFLKKGGQIERSEIIIRDWQHPERSGFMLPSANDAPKRDLSQRKKRTHKYTQRNKALAVMAKHENLSVDQIAEMAGVSQTTARAAVDYAKYAVLRLSSARPPELKELILQYANNTTTAEEVAEHTGASVSYVFRTCAQNGVRLKKHCDELTDIEKAILSIKTWAYTAKEISAKVGCTEQHVRVVCKKYGYKIKSAVRNYD